MAAVSFSSSPCRSFARFFVLRAGQATDSGKSWNAPSRALIIVFIFWLNHQCEMLALWTIWIIKTMGKLHTARITSTGAQKVIAIFVDADACPVKQEICGDRRTAIRVHDPALDEHSVEIVPIRVSGVNEPDFPGARPMLYGILTLNGISDVVKALQINQPLQAMTPSKSVNKSFPMLEGALRQVACDAGIQDTVTSIGHKINPAAPS